MVGSPIFVAEFACASDSGLGIGTPVVPAVVYVLVGSSAMVTEWDADSVKVLEVLTW